MACAACYTGDHETPHTFGRDDCRWQSPGVLWANLLAFGRPGLQPADPAPAPEPVVHREVVIASGGGARSQHALDVVITCSGCGKSRSMWVDRPPAFLEMREGNGGYTRWYLCSPEPRVPIGWSLVYKNGEWVAGCPRCRTDRAIVDVVRR